MSEVERLREALKQAYFHVGSMLPERLESVNARQHEKAMTVLRRAIDAAPPPGSAGEGAVSEVDDDGHL